LIVPSLRGFGNSTHPGNVKFSGTVQDSVGDLTCILNHAGVQEVICMGQVSDFFYFLGVPANWMEAIADTIGALRYAMRWRGQDQISRRQL
jgi:hypothetical protein